MLNKKRAVAVAVLTAACVALTGCATGARPTATLPPVSCEPSTGKVNLDFTSWIPGIEDVVDVWNEENPDIQVKVQTGPNGNGGTYQNFFNQLKAGNAPDLGQIEYDALPNFRVQDGLTDLAACDDVLDAKDEFVDWTWGQVSFGEEDAVYAIPQDAGPDGHVLPLRPVRGEQHRRSDHVGRVRRGRRRRCARPAATSPTSRRATSTSSPVSSGRPAAAGSRTTASDWTVDLTGDDLARRSPTTGRT